MVMTHLQQNEISLITHVLCSCMFGQDEDKNALFDQIYVFQEMNNKIKLFLDSIN